MGAFVGAALAAQSPELVSGLVLIDGGYALAFPPGVDSQAVLNMLLADRLGQLRETYPSREAYRHHWRNKPHFPAADWNRWVEAFLDYEIESETTHFRPKASEAGVRVDIADGMQTADIAARLRAVKVPVQMLRAEKGFLPSQPPLYPDWVMPGMRDHVPGMQDEVLPGTTHYTIVLGESGASRIADRIAEFSAQYA